MTKRRISSEDLSSGDNYASNDVSPSTSSRKRISKPSQKTSKTTKKRAKATPDSDTEGIGAAARPHSIKTHSITNPGPMRQALLEWYSGVQETRGMPWRKPFDASLDGDGRSQRAYEVWISEIMLQQTQVATVIPYYNRWMEKFPTLRHLASADIEQVNALWKGLGYYSRAARLLAGAQKCMDDSTLAGRLPDNAKDMEALIPGIGRYSAGAICSIAYGERVPVLDGNVTRLMSRILALHAPIKAKATLDLLWKGAESMVELSNSSADNEARKEGDAGDVNQALIELGSTVCKVKDPTCTKCPVREWCGAFKLACSPTTTLEASNLEPQDVADIEDSCNLCQPQSRPISVNAFPMKAEKKKAREEIDLVSVVEWRPRLKTNERWFLIVRRPEGGLLAGLHEFPTSANVPFDSASITRQAASAHTLLGGLLVEPPAAFHVVPTKSTFFEPERRQEDLKIQEGSLRITKIRGAGDVLHVFSHIRKTYRVQWVLLEGGEDAPPKLVTDGTPPLLSTTGKKGKKGADSASEKQRKTPNAPGKHGTAITRWVPLEEVANANIGTGVMKVWEQVKSVWKS